MKFIGIDVHLRSLAIACIDENLNILKIKDMDKEGLIKYLEKDEVNILAVDAPYGLNLGLMNDEEYRKKLNPNLKDHYNKKVSEYELSRRGITPFSTPDNLEKVTGWKSWMEIGLNLYDSLEGLGYKRINRSFENINKGIIEVFPHASFTTLAGYKLSKKTTDEGLAERIDLLNNVGFKKVNEIVTGTKHVKSDKLDAIVAAYTAYLTYYQKVSFLGDAKEGEIVIPIEEIKEKYTYIKKDTIEKKCKYLKDFDYINHDVFEYDYINVDNIVWLKYFQEVKGDIYNIIDFKKNPNLLVGAKIYSYDDDRNVEVVFEPIKNSIYGMKVLKEYKDTLKSFWGVHGNKKKYKMLITLLRV